MTNVLHGRLAITLAASFFCAAAYSDAQGTFVLTNGYVSNIDGGSNVNFSLTFNQVPDFFTVDQSGRQANSFQFAISTSTNVSTTPPYASIIMGDEIHVAGDIPINSADGSIRGSVPYALNGQTLTFSVPSSVLNVSGPFGYWLILMSYGGMTDDHRGLSGGPIIPPPPPVGRYTITTSGRDTSFTPVVNDTTSYFIPAINNQGQAGGVVVQTADISPMPWFGQPGGFVFSCTAQIFPNIFPYTNTVCVGNQTGVVVWALNDQGILAGSIGGNAAIFSPGYTNGYALLDRSRLGVATRIDSVGQVVGAAQVLNAPQYAEAMFWHAGQSTHLGTLKSGDSSTAVSLNQRSEIVGCSEPGQWAYQYDNTMPYHSFPVSWSTYRPAARAFLWKNGLLKDLNNLIPTNSGWILNVATDINDQGQIVGVGTKAGHPAGFLYYRGTVSDLGVIGTNITLNAINQWGQIVGGADGRAFIWENGVVQDLNDFLPTGSQWVLGEAVDINDLGQIIGTGSLPQELDLSTIYASRSLFQLTPTTPPGPPSLAMSRQGTNVILSWPTGVVGLGVESATNFVTGGWNTNYPLPVVVAGRYTVTNPITRLFKVYRLFMP